MKCTSENRALFHLKMAMKWLQDAEKVKGVKVKSDD